MRKFNRPADGLLVYLSREQLISGLDGLEQSLQVHFATFTTFTQSEKLNDSRGDSVDTYQNKNPLVSIVMPAYNAVATIADSISSVLAQTYQNWELFIINDASSDKTGEMVKPYADIDSRFHLVENAVNQGVAATRNVGIAQAKGEYIAFLDSDDLWHREKLEKQVRLMDEKCATISYTGTSYMNSVGNISKYILQAEECFSQKELLRRNIMSCSSVMVRRDSMVSFPKGFMHEDYSAWLEVLRQSGHAYGLNEPLLIYRMREASKSASRIKSAIMNRNSYRHAGYGQLISTLLMFRYAIHSITKRAFIKAGI